MKSIVRNLIIVFVLLSIPLVAMQFTDEVEWGAGDFLVGGIILFCLISGIDYLLHRIENRKYRVLAIILLLVVFFLIWVELAVGIFPF